MKRSIREINERLNQLYRKELDLEREIRKDVKEPAGMVKVMARIGIESKLRKLREDIEEEEYNLYEANILKSLRIR